ncbi:MAG TPA: M20/M25/M40 family metallo-hydrolase [Bryobacteraceae bacterium]|nr:M20/M25/M40 family metallo-hydrolase [Bryobacteraceae bacterium]
MNKSLMACVLVLVSSPATFCQSDDQGQARFRETYKELVETNTTLSAGDCTLAATRMAARLKAAGYGDQDVRIFVPEGHPKEGGLLAVLHGADPNAKAVLMLAHVDVVEAKREDWTRDPFTLIEENGYFYARGANDDKAQAAIWVDNLMRYREENFRPKRSIKLALTCGEETSSALNGAGWLAAHEREAIDAEFALNEVGSGVLDADGRRIALQVQAGEKTSQNFRLEVTNPGGHSSLPVPDNAIYHLVRAVDRISRYEFPVQFNEANRGYFTAMSKIVGGEAGAAMTAVLKDPGDAASIAVLDKNRSWHAMLRTTCVATMLSAGHATNALPQRATANVNCRIFPGVSRDTILAKLVELATDAEVKVTVPEVRGPAAEPAPLTPQIMGPIKQISDELWPNVPVVPVLLAGATDAQFLNPVGIPTYGVSGLFQDADAGNVHGLNERIRVRSLYEGRTFLYRLVKIYAEQ